MLSILFSVIVGATDAPIEISECTYRSEMSVISCDIKNTGTTAIAQIWYGVIARDRDRKVPWSEQTDSDEFVAAISGGIEPGETLNHTLRLPRVPMRAKVETLIIELIGVSTLDSEGNPLTMPPKPQPAP